MQRTVCIDAPVERVWAVLSNLPAIEQWVEAIQHAHCPGPSRGVGAQRVCELKQATLIETIIDWQEGRSFTYQGIGAPMMQHAQNTWSVEAHGHQTLVTSRAEVVLKGGRFGRLLEPLVRAMSSRLGGQSLGALKYLVEHGRAPDRGTSFGPLPTHC
jgi:uncharacterized protein YndB with AHSA1/START domain